MTEMIDSRPGISKVVSASNPPAASLPTVPWSWPELDRRPQAPSQRTVLGLPIGSAESLFTACWAEQQAQRLRTKSADGQHKGALTLAIADSAGRYQRLLQEVKAWQPGLRVAGLGDWETLAYEAFSPHQDLISERLNSLYLAITGQLDLLIVAAPTALQRLPPTHYLAANTFFFRTGQSLSVDRLRQQLQTAGYSPVGQVFSPSEYAIRGGLIDLYPMGSSLPYRIELFDDEIASIRVFDPESQRSVHPVREVRILPGREYPRDAESASRLRSRWRETFEGDPSRCSLYRDAGNGLFGPGIEYYLPLLFDELADLTAYLHPEAQILLVGDVQSSFEQTFSEVKTRWEFLRHDIERPVLAPEIILQPVHLFNQALGGWGQTLLSDKRDQPIATPAPDVRADRQATPVLGRLQRAISAAAEQGCLTVVSVDTEGRRETLAEMLQDSDIAFQRCELNALPALLSQKNQTPQQTLQSGCLLTVSPLHQGFESQALGLVLITEFELFADLQRRQRHGQRAKQTNVDAIIRDLSELKLNDPVVHLQHGVGRYQGLINMDLGDGPNEFLHLVYDENAVLYVPVAQLHLISRYSGSDPDSAPLHRLGGGQWEKAKSKAAKQAKDTAAELLNLYARRAAREGHAFAFQASDYERFADGFGFEETPDQLAAIHAVVQDMVSGKPMDRLVCGDVGFGKTEVALRAAFVAVMDGKQVAVLCPTTLLAEQHFQTFKDRFAAWPVKLAELSRFKSGKEVNESLEELAKGRIDIVIGTHQLLSARTQFQRLGLIIIDEEHRFGVRQKEALKSLRAEVDVLTLTATPIPRTLAMSMEGIRDFSIIATAPQKRLAIKTMVRQDSDGTVREALLRELRRGGQAYVLHNQVETIQHRLEMLQALLPEARIGVAHGQLPERELEQVMRDFHQQRINVLLCTTIIETGIDVPTANTIVIYRADRFGLAQLHQLRGRVGRSHHQAYAYLLVPDEESISRDAKKRLEAITSMEELGSGFFLAMHDLEIRGAGEVLGDSQSGNMTEVGFQLYADMLQEAVNALKAGREPDLDMPVTTVTEIQLHLPALLPEDYCHDIRERLSLYKRMASAETQEDLSDLQEELIDRFGKLPEPARALLETHRLRLRCKDWNVIKVDAGPERVAVQFGPHAPVNPAKVIKLIQTDSRYRLQGNDRLRADIASTQLPERLQVLQTLFQHVLDSNPSS